MAFERNVGGIDMAIRVAIGVALVGVAMFAEINAAWRTVAWIGAAAALITVVVGFCPINKVLGIDTSKLD
jgi:hypothetical protein